MLKSQKTEAGEMITWLGSWSDGVEKLNFLMRDVISFLNVYSRLPVYHCNV